ncbi:hypothetical protein F4679DRAFT_592474 [Xylaria curta]|nr:hypothetical protein F4679DRAFT_592474 [Xylaria curta]
MSGPRKSFSGVSEPSEIGLTGIIRAESTQHTRDISSEISIDCNAGDFNCRSSHVSSVLISEDSSHLSAGPESGPSPPRQLSQPCKGDTIAPSCNGRLWISPWLRNITLVTFAIVFTIMWVTLIILWRYALQNNGFAITLSTSHYSWTYGPTVIITFVSTLWRRVDYHCKLTRPWKEMNKGPVDSSKSLLLDYISPLQVTTFCRAFRHRHWEVALSILTFALLKATMLLSTVLLVSSPTSFPCIVPLAIGSKFDISEFWHESIYENGSSFVFQGDPHAYAYDVLTPEAIIAYEGVILDKIKEPLGIQGDVAFQTFDRPAIINNLTQVSAIVDGFVSNISCEVSQVGFPDSPWQGSLTLDSPSCSVGHFTKSLNVLVCREDCPPYNATFNILRVNCSEAEDIITGHNSLEHIPIDENTPYDLRVALVAINYTNTEITNVHALPNTTLLWNSSWAVNPTRTAAAICKFDYNVQKVQSTMDILTGSFQINILNDSTSSSQLHNLTGLQLGEIHFGFANHPFREFSDLIIESRHDQTAGQEILFDPELMADGAHNVFTGITAQLARQRWMVADNITMNGTGVCNENRLHIQLTSLWGMIAVLTIASILPLLMVFLNTGGVLPLNPSSIAAHAAILACSPSLDHLFARTGSLRTSELTKWLDGHIFKSAFDNNGRFQIVAFGRSPLYYKVLARRRLKDSRRGSDLKLEDVKVKKGTWLPLAASYPFLSLTFVLPILAIAALEVLYQISQHNQGLVRGYYASLPYIQYATSFVVLATATMFNSVDFTIQSFSPFDTLSKATASADSSIFNNFLDDIPPVALYRAVRMKNFGAALSNAASTIGSLQWENSAVDDGGAAALFNSISLGGTTSPEGVWGDLAFPDLNNIEIFDDNFRSMLDNTTSAHLSFTVPALRPGLICDSVPTQNTHFKVYNFTDANNNNDAYVNNFLIDIGTRINLPNYCPGGPRGNRDYFWFNETISTRQGEPCWRGSLYDANVFPVHLGPWNESHEDFDDVGESAPAQGMGSTLQPDNPNGCPSIVVVFAYLGIHQLTKDNVTVLLCSQKIEEVQVEATLRAFQTKRVGQQSLLSQPIVLESTATYLTNGTDGINSFNYRIEPHFRANVTGTNRKIWTTIFDTFFDQLVFGANGTAPEDITGQKNVDKLKESVNNIYKRYMVQVINTSIFRKPLSNAQLQDPLIFRGTASAAIPRLTVEYTSKLVLQIMLAAMVVLEALSLSQIKLRGLLPRNPYSIASTMALLAGSKLCSIDFTIGDTEQLDKKLKKAFAQHKFGLGWWYDADSATIQRTEEAEDPNNWRFGIDIGQPDSSGFLSKVQEERGIAETTHNA